MEKAIITSKDFITEGGCNACGPVNCATYTLTFADGKTSTLEDLDVASLVMTLTQKAGWQVELNFDSDEDQTVFEKNGIVVSQIEDYGKVNLTFQHGNKTIKTKNRLASPELFAVINQIMAELFEEETVKLTIE